MSKSEKAKLPRWAEKKPLEKGLTVLSLLCALSVVVLSVFSFVNNRRLSGVIEILICFTFFLCAIQNKKYNKKIATIFAVCAVVFLFLGLAYIFIW